VLSPLLL